MPPHLRSGDALALEDGRLVEVVAAPEPLLEIRCTDPLHLARVAWHLGNRHVPTQLLAKSLRIRRDHVLEEMLRGLGARVIEIEAPFDPEGGAYASTASTTVIMTAITTVIPITMDTTMSDEAMSPDALYRLLTWLSPAYPVGAFSYSSGIEWAVEAGDITDAESLRHWLEAMLADGAGMNDGIFFVQAYSAIANSDDAALAELAELSAAFVPTRERHLETINLGRAFIDVTCAAWPCPALTHLQKLWSGPITYPVAVGVACAGHDIPLVPATHAFLDRADNQLDFGGRSLDPARPYREPEAAADAGAGGNANRTARAWSNDRRSRQRDVSRRPRKRDARDAIYASVSEPEATEIFSCPAPMARFVSASAARSVPARPR